MEKENKNLKIVLCQAEMVWEDAEKTILSLDRTVRQYISEHGVPDLMLFPEFFSVGFTMNPDVTEENDGMSASWLESISREFGMAVAGSVPTFVGPKTQSGERKRVNRLHFKKADGSCAHYDKKHLFNYSGEGTTYSPGKDESVVDLKGWRIALNICYDLRFPVWSRNIGNKYDLLVNVASWPSPRVSQARILIRARAVENCSYAVFCNRVGVDPYCEYNGGSMIVDTRGEEIGDCVNVCGTDFFRAELDMEALTGYREKFPAWMDADKFKLE